jgi:hypothetical protein
VTGTSGANVTEDNYTTVGGGKIDLTDLFVSGGDPSGTGACSYIGLEVSSGGHSLSTNGVEVKSGDTTRTLVGMVYADGAHSVSDSATARNVASWFNRRARTCRNVWTSDATASSSSPTYAELKAGGTTTLHCQFVSWDRDDLAWSLFGGGSVATGQTADVSVGFDSTSSA